MIGGSVIRADFTLYGSFAKTYHGHGTDRALLGGIMGFSTDDMRIRNSFEIAQENRPGLYLHPERDRNRDSSKHCGHLHDQQKRPDHDHRGESLGGGKVRIVRINDVKVDFTGEYSAVIVVQQDKPGVVAHITKVLSDRGVNIAFMRLFREAKGHTAYTIVESDGKLPEDVAEYLKDNVNVRDVMVVQI